MHSSPHYKDCLWYLPYCFHLYVESDLLPIWHLSDMVKLGPGPALPPTGPGEWFLNFLVTLSLLATYSSPHPPTSQHLAIVRKWSPATIMFYSSAFKHSVQFSRSVVSDSLWPHKPQHTRPPSITNPQSSPKLMSIESVMPSSHLIFCHPLLLLPSVFPTITHLHLHVAPILYTELVRFCITICQAQCVAESIHSMNVHYWLPWWLRQ